MATTNHSPLDRYMVTEKYIVTRGTALHFPPKIFGKLVTSKDTIYGVVVDMPMSPTLLGTLVMYINGAANLYFNNGAEYIGAAQKYQTVAQPARIAVVLQDCCRKPLRPLQPTCRMHSITIFISSARMVSIRRICGWQTCRTNPRKCNHSSTCISR